MKTFEEYKKAGKIEQYWTDLTAKHLVGKTITKVEYLSDKEIEENMWNRKPLAICLDNKHWLIPTIDDEGNDGGAVHTTIKELRIIPVI